MEAKAPCTTAKYSTAFYDFKVWASKYDEITPLPAEAIAVALYIEHLFQNQCPYSKIESAYYGINWAHNMYGLQSPCQSGLVKHAVEAAKRHLSKPIQKKEPVTFKMTSEICKKYAGPNANLSGLRLAAICVTAFHGFLRFNEIMSLRGCDIKFCEQESACFVELDIIQSKTDVYREDAKVLLAKTNDDSCPFNILLRYVRAAEIDLASTEPFFRCLQFCKSTNSYKLRSAGMSYTRTREIVLEAFAHLGYEVGKFGLHSLRSGGATAAANAGIKDRLFKRHGRWKSENAKDGYVKDELEALLSVSRSLHGNERK